MALIDLGAVQLRQQTIAKETRRLADLVNEATEDEPNTEAIEARKARVLAEVSVLFEEVGIELPAEEADADPDPGPDPAAVDSTVTSTEGTPSPETT